MINTVDEFMEEFLKHKDKCEWYLHAPTPLADHTQLRGRDILCHKFIYGVYHSFVLIY